MGCAQEVKVPMAAVASMHDASVTRLRSGTECVWEVTEKGLPRVFDPMRDKNQRHLLIKEGGVSKRTVKDIRGPKA